MARCDSYLFGECTYYVCETSPWIPEGLGNATDWLADARSLGLQVGSQPQVGAVAVYAAGAGYSEFGHVALVRSVYGPDSFLVSEMNFTGWDVVDTRVSGRWGLEGFIYPPPGYQPPGGGMVLSGDDGDGGPPLLEAWAWVARLINQRMADLASGLAGLATQARGL